MSAIYKNGVEYGIGGVKKRIWKSGSSIWQSINTVQIDNSFWVNMWDVTFTDVKQFCQDFLAEYFVEEPFLIYQPLLESGQNFWALMGDRESATQCCIQIAFINYNNVLYENVFRVQRTTSGSPSVTLDKITTYGLNNHSCSGLFGVINVS